MQDVKFRTAEPSDGGFDIFKRILSGTMNDLTRED